MENSRWWHLAIGAATVLLLALVLLFEAESWRVVGGIASAIVFALGWMLAGRFAWRSGRAALGYMILVVVIAGVGTAFVPAFAFIQFVAYPLVWSLSPTLRNAIAWNIALTVAVSAGFLVSVGTAPAELTRTFAIQSISLGFSMAFGFWITSISTKSNERQLLLDELRLAQTNVARLNRDAGVTAERERMAREIHDTIAQSLAGLVMLAERARLERDPLARDGQLAMLEESARAALTEARSLIAATAPVTLAHGGLAEALTRLADRFTRETGVTVTVAAEPIDVADRDGEVVLLRCAQEGLANVRKHAGASAAHLALTVTGETVGLMVSDDGSGFDASESHLGFGLPGLRDRLALVGGTLTVTSSATSGTTVQAYLPRVERAR